MSEHGTPDKQAAPILPRIRATWRDQHVVLIFPPDQHFPQQEEVAYTLEEVDGLYITLYQHRRLLSGASYSIIPSPDHTAFCRLSGEGSVLLLAELREIRHRLGLADPPDDPWQVEELDHGKEQDGSR